MPQRLKSDTATKIFRAEVWLVSLSLFSRQDEREQLETLLPPKTSHEVLVDEISRRYYDTVTKAAEALDGVMHSEFPLGFNGQDIYSRKDGTNFGEMMRNSLEVARQQAVENPNTLFNLRRTEIENEEHQIMIDMMNGDAPNTMIVVSDMPFEIESIPSELREGYNLERKMTMLRLIMKDDITGEMTLVSHSLDLSDRDALEAIYDYLGVKAVPGELLGQRIQTDFNQDQQLQLCSNLVSAHDNKLAEKHGGAWSSGRKIEDGQNRINTYDFMLEQDDVVLSYINSAFYGDEHSEFGVMQVLKDRYRTAVDPNLVQKEYSNRINYSPQMSDYQLQAILNQAFIGGVAEGSTFYFCGGSMGESSRDDYENAGYLSSKKSKEELSWHGGKVKQGKCVNCKDETEVGVENWCEGCIRGHCG